MCTVEPFSVGETVGEWHFGCYTEAAAVEGLEVYVSSGLLAVISQMALVEG